MYRQGPRGTRGELLEDASSRVLGELERTMRSTSGVLLRWRTSSRALREATGAQAAAVDMIASQAPMDGVLSYLPAGPVTEADMLRLYPWPDATARSSSSSPSRQSGSSMGPGAPE